MSDHGSAEGKAEGGGGGAPLLPPSFLSRGGPSLADSFSFSVPRSRLLPLLETPAPLRATSNCRDARPSTGRARLPDSLDPAVASAGAGAGADALAPVSAGVLEAAITCTAGSSGAEDGLDDWACADAWCLLSRVDLLLLGEGGGLAVDDAAGAPPAFGGVGVPV